MKKLDLLLINPGAAHKVYQDLAGKFSAVEPNTWALLLAASVRAKGFSVDILDCDALRLSDNEAAETIKYLNPRFAIFVVYGQNPNSGTTSLTGAVSLAQKIYGDVPVGVIGSHAQALPEQVLSHWSIDFVMTGEGVYALHNLLLTNNRKDWDKVRGIGYKTVEGQVLINEYADIVSEDKLDEVLPGYAWDLLPYKNKPFDLYRSCNWHAMYKEELRSPYAAIYTSLGCSFGCNFCMINLINRTKAGNNVSAADSRVLRKWSPAWVLRQIEALQAYGVDTIRFSDELFFLDKRHYEPILQGIVDRELHPLIWCYSRVNTVRKEFLDLFRMAGVRWLALGIESANQTVRQEIDKGRFKDVDIREVVQTIRDADINVIGNYIFGLPSDTLETMQQTLDLSIELNTEAWNGYPSMALPGSPLYLEAKSKGMVLPSNYSAWSFHSYDCQPMNTDYLTAAQVLKFRDDAWHTYHSNDKFLNLIENKFGLSSRQHIEEMSKIKLKRKILGD
jgi:anaerobic magnesium-protoporphyrin IX monomethyl ester cyclase